jgi:hypothetical protein
MAYVAKKLKCFSCTNECLRLCGTFDLETEMFG